MSNYNSLKSTIDANVKQNGRQEITGQILNSVLNQMVTSLGAGYMYVGVASPSTSPGTPDSKVFYVAATPGTYANFGGLSLSDGEVAILKWDSSWHKDLTGIATESQIASLRQSLTGIDKEIGERTSAIVSTTDLQGTSISSLQGYIAGNTTIRSTTSNYWMYLYRIPKYSYVTLTRRSAPADTFVLAGKMDDASNFVVGGSIQETLMVGSDTGTREFFFEKESYLVILSNATSENRYVNAFLSLTQKVEEKLNSVAAQLTAEIAGLTNRVDFLEEGKNLVTNLDFIRAFINNSGVISATTTRLLSKRISGDDGVLTISTKNAASNLKVIWVRIVSGQTAPQAISNWLTTKVVNVSFLRGYDYYIEIAKTDDSAITTDDIANISIYYDNGAILACNKNTIANFANVKRPFHRYSSSGTYKDCLTLGYFSDVHSDTDNIRRIAEFCDKFLLDDILQTGDLIASSLSQGVPSNWATLGKKILGVIGNHDAQNNEGGSWVTQPQLMSYNTIIAPFVADWGVTQPDGASANGFCYWYKDYADQKIRLIALDCMHWDSTQLSWFTSVLSSARSSNYSVVIAVHYLPFAMQHTDTAFDSVDFTPTSSVGDFFASPEIADAVASFMAAGGEFICYLTGHVHIDLFGVGVAPYQDQLCISIATASAQNSATTYGDTARVIGTKSQDCLNILGFDTTSKTIKIYRIGVDHDRFMRTKDFISWNYATKTLIK